MTRICGIYALKWGTDVYVGKSVNIARRLTAHKTAIKYGTHYNELINQKNLDDLITEILEECSVESLTEKECYWINALQPNLNICKSLLSGWPTQAGPDHGMALYSKDQILEVFDLLLEDKKYKEISEITKVSYSVVSQIAIGNLHRWLETFVGIENYKKLLDKRKKQVYLVSNGGSVQELSGTNKEFCDINNINYSNFSQMLKGKRKTANGYFLVGVKD
jgi:hypothetical protein